MIDESGAILAKSDVTRIGLREIVGICWHYRVLITLTMVILVVVTAVAAWLIPRQYEATVLLSPVTSQTTASGLGALGSTLSQLGGVASLAGLSLTGSNSARAEEIATLQSEAVTEAYIRQNDLLPILYKMQWDSVRKTWNTNNPEKIPTLWKANRYFSHAIRTVTESSRSGLVTMTITWGDAALAAKWANGLVKLTNDYLRRKAIDESERNIAYLNDEVAKTNVVELRSAIYALMETEIKKEMMARGNDEYAFEVVDPATVPEQASFPKKLLWVGAAAGIGFFVGVLLAVARYTFVLEGAVRS